MKHERITRRVVAKWKRSRVRQSKRWMDCVEEDLRRAGGAKFTGKHREHKERHCAALQRTENSGESW